MKHSTSFWSSSKSRLTVSFGKCSEIPTIAAENSAYLLVICWFHCFLLMYFLNIQKNTHVMRTHFLTELRGITVTNTLDVQSENIFESWPNRRLQRVPILVQCRDATLMTHQLVPVYELDAKEHGNGVEALHDIRIQVFLKRKKFYLLVTESSSRNSQSSMSWFCP